MKITNKRVPVLFQSERAECGATCLGMILAYYQKYVSPAELRIRCCVSRDGSMLKNMISAARGYSMNVQSFLAPPELPDIQLPCIVLWQRRHFVVVERIGKKDIVICDPASGRKLITKEEFKAYYSGIAVQAVPGEDFLPEGKPMRILPELFALTGRNTRVFVYLSILSVLLSLTGIVISMISGQVVNEYLPSKGTISTAGLFAGLGALALLQLIIYVTEDSILLRFERLLSGSSMEKIMNKALSLPLTYFSRRSRSSLVMNIGAADSCSTFLSTQLVPILVNCLFVIVCGVILFLYSPVIAVIVIAVTALTGLASQLLVKRSKAIAAVSKQEENILYGAQVQTVRLFDSVKASSLEDRMFENIAVSYNEYENSVQKSRNYTALMQVFSLTAPLVLQLVIVIIGGILVIQNGSRFEVGNLLTLQAISMSFFSPMIRLIGQFSALQQLDQNVRNIKDIMEEPAEERPQPEEAFSRPADGSLEVRNVRYGYNPSLAPVISDISFTVPDGSSLAIVGRSGSGKTTLLRLLKNVISPWSGSICFGGVPVQDIRRTDLASLIGVVDQTPSLFEGTVRDNITMFDAKIPEEEIVSAAKAACIHEDILAMPDGYDTLISQDGSNISGGQRQRMMIARALLRKPSILILDEATSALDTLIEEEIMHNISSMKVTTVIAAHRLSTIRDCNEIILLEKGQIIERGAHEELIAAEDSLYRKLVLSEELQ
ncbi:MAG: ATP-binding cassette domain-containing protein [Eubacteriales bacterium]|nr:ATP-binding cassette domain-containing protein [Eubacteriales bacterium]